MRYNTQKPTDPQKGVTLTLWKGVNTSIGEPIVLIHPEMIIISSGGSMSCAGQLRKVKADRDHKELRETVSRIRRKKKVDRILELQFRTRANPKTSSRKSWWCD